MEEGDFTEFWYAGFEFDDDGDTSSDTDDDDQIDDAEEEATLSDPDFAQAMRYALIGTNTLSERGFISMHTWWDLAPTWMGSAEYERLVARGNQEFHQILMLLFGQHESYADRFLAWIHFVNEEIDDMLLDAERNEDTCKLLNRISFRYYDLDSIRIARVQFDIRMV